MCVGAGLGVNEGASVGELAGMGVGLTVGAEVDVDDGEAVAVGFLVARRACVAGSASSPAAGEDEGTAAWAQLHNVRATIQHTHLLRDIRTLPVTALPGSNMRAKQRVIDEWQTRQWMDGCVGCR